MSKSIIFEIKKEELQKIINKCFTLTDVLRELHLSVTSGTARKNLKKRIADDCLDISSLQRRSPFANRTPKYSNEEWFVDGVERSTSSSKTKLLKMGAKYECSECGIGGEYNGKPLSLHLDHADGDRKNNKVSNLRFLCPNCHSQTETYGGRNKSNKMEDNEYFKRSRSNACECGEVKSIASNTCMSCFDKKRKKNQKDLTTKSELEKMIKEKSMIDVGKHFGVSDNAIRKWCKNFGIDLSKAKNSRKK